MAGSILDGKSILGVDDEPEVLEILEEEIKEVCPNSTFEKASTYEQAVERMVLLTYDVVILDIMGVRGFDLLELAQTRNFPVVMLTAHALTPEALKRSYEMGARAYLPKEKLGEIVPLLEDMLRYENLPGWRRLLEKMEGFFNERWGQHWKKGDEKFWKEFEEKMSQTKK